MNYSLTQTVAPTKEILSLFEIKTHLKIENTDEDAFLESLIKAARQMLETKTGRAMTTATYVVRLDKFPDDEIRLPFPPLISVSSITYIDTDGELQTWSSSLYLVDKYSVPARIVPAYNETFPETRDQPAAVTVTFTAGEANPPETAKQYVRMLVGHWFENREGVLTGSIQAPFAYGLDALAGQLATGIYR